MCICEERIWKGKKPQKKEQEAKNDRKKLTLDEKKKAQYSYDNDVEGNLH